jgi:hypothetical protein
MTNKKYLIIAVLATFCLTATLFMIVPTHSQSSNYDPWTDINNDGTIDMADISMTIDGFMTNGDSTKDVNVTNWPTSQAVTLWYRKNFTLSQTQSIAPMSSANGFGHLHIILYAYNMSSGQSVTLSLVGTIMDPAGMGYAATYIPGGNLTVSNPGSTQNATTVPVPSESFYFILSTNMTGQGAQMYAGYYLTWS